MTVCIVSARSGDDIDPAAAIKADDVVVGEQERLGPPAAVQQARRRDLVARVDGVQVAGEAAHHAEALGRPRRVRVRRPHSPVERQIDADVLGATKSASTSAARSSLWARDRRRAR